MNHETAVRAMKQVLGAITEAIAKAGQDGIPAGHLYAMLMNFGITLNQYQEIESFLIAAGKIKKRGDLLIAA